MKIYTYQIGTATGNEIHTLAHSETIYAPSLVEAIEIARETTRSKYALTDANMVRLLEELDGDSQVMWFRPKEALL
jgi:hypothetical protein